MPAVNFEGGYASPHLRKAVLDKLHPYATTQAETVPIDEAFPPGHWQGEGQPIEAIVFTIFANDGLGTFWQGVKEIDTREQDKKSRTWRDREQTAEAWATDRTKAMGRALGDAGIPQRVPELRLLMSWIAELEGRPPALSRRVNSYTGEIGKEDIDAPDAGGDDEKSLAQIVAERVMGLDGPLKAHLSKMAREELGITNLMQSGEQAQDVLRLIGRIKAEPTTEE